MDKAVYQRGMTIVAPLRPGTETAVGATLDAIYDDVESNPLLPFKACRRIHFARLLTLPASNDATGRTTPAVLVLSTNYDAPEEKHLDELYAKGKDGLDRLFAHCEGYPGPDDRTAASFKAYVRAHDLGPGTLYVGTRGLTVPQIHRDAQLYDAIQTFLDEEVQTNGVLDEPERDVRRRIQAFVRDANEFAWAREPHPVPRRFWPYGSDARLAALVLLLLGLPLGVGAAMSASSGWATLGVEAAAVVLGAVALRRKESSDPEDPPVTDYDHLSRLLSREDVHSQDRPIVQNQMTSVTNVKPGWLRRTLLTAVLRVIDVFGRYKYTKGKLGTIPSIHFGRWVMIDEGRRLLFFSNFDGSWENYLGDFIDKAHSGLTAIWSNTDGFPRTRWLVKDGATDEQRFKAYARNSQTVTQVWYSAYKYLSVQNIRNNAAVRAGLFAEQTDAETRDWLRRF